MQSAKDALRDKRDRECPERSEKRICPERQENKKQGDKRGSELAILSRQGYCKDNIELTSDR